MKKLLVFVLIVHSPFLYSQIQIDNNIPYDSEVFLINNVLLSDGVEASNHSFQGDSQQIAYFNGSASNLGLDGGIVLSTGNVYTLDPNFNAGFGPVTQTPPITDPDLLNVANSVPQLIGQTFDVIAINDVAVLEFDFIPNSDTISFRYVFGSVEYFGFENSSFNDVFGFFISGPGINGPYSSPSNHPDGSINIAVFESQEANTLGQYLPITISSICNNPILSSYNPQFFINNENTETISEMDGFTTPMTATALVQCGETYHIRLAIADGSDHSLNSFVFLEEKSFMSTSIEIENSLGLDTNHIVIDCGNTVDLSAQIESPDNYDILWNTGQSTPTIEVAEGIYWFSATNDGCIQNSDTIRIEENSFRISLDSDTTICRGDSIIIELESSEGQSPYSFDWSTNQTTPSIKVGVGQYILALTDANGCVAKDSINIHAIERPLATLRKDGFICEGRSNPKLDFNIINGTPPYYFTYSDGLNEYTDTTNFTYKQLEVNREGTYRIVEFKDKYCDGLFSGQPTVEEIKFKSHLMGGGQICEGDSQKVIIQSDIQDFPCKIRLKRGFQIIEIDSIQSMPYHFYVDEQSVYEIETIIDDNQCHSFENSGLASIVNKTLLEPNIISVIDSILCPVDSAIQLEAIPQNGVWWGKGMQANGVFVPVNAYQGEGWVYYSFPLNCNETDSLRIIVDCEVTLFIPNSFTPNGDGFNEFFRIYGNNILDFEMSIFNRWGEKVFHTKSLNYHWDGRYKHAVVQPGVYTYSISYYGKDANYKDLEGTLNVLK
ncbi:MAG: choice-of-anchor L domain-containing protein [Flavobacteriales bacterium]